MMIIDYLLNAVAESAQPYNQYGIQGTTIDNQEIETDKQISKLFEEVNWMKIFME